MVQKNRQFTFTDGILLSALVLVGGFHEYIACGLSVAMCLYLLLQLHRKRLTALPQGLFFTAVTVICLGYGVSALWAIDRGMALIGFVKFLPLPLYLLCLHSQEQEGVAILWLPYVAAAMAVISAIGMLIPGWKAAFSVADRLAGFFQYPNTFALLLLVGELLLLKKEKRSLWDYLVLAVLVGALLYTGSRTVFAVALLANGAMLFTQAKRKGKAMILAACGVVCLALVVLAFSENSVINRFLRFSLTESTLVGRILYVQDALPLLLKYPFGMGYMGYYYMQGSIQTGLYSVTHIHNELLQLLLDIGWIPTAVFVVALIKWFCQKAVALPDKIIVGAVCLHSLFDFNLQFTGMFFVLLLLTRQVPTNQPKPKKLSPILRPVALAAGCLSLYLGVCLALAHFGAWQTADLLYPGNTRNKLTMLEQVEDVTEADRLSDEILKNNKHYYAPYMMKAKYAYAQGNFGAMITYANQGIALNPLEYTQYEDYCRMLLIGVELYTQAGDSASAQACIKALRYTVEALDANAQRLSQLGKRIADQPITQLPQDLMEQIERLGGGS